MEVSKFIQLQKYVSMAISFVFNRLILPGKDSAMTHMFTRAGPNTVFYEVNQNNVREDLIFPKFKDQVQRLLADAHTTLWSQHIYILTSTEYKNCLVTFSF